MGKLQHFDWIIHYDTAIILIVNFGCLKIFNNSVTKTLRDPISIVSYYNLVTCWNANHKVSTLLKVGSIMYCTVLNIISWYISDAYVLITFFNNSITNVTELGAVPGNRIAISFKSNRIKEIEDDAFNNIRRLVYLDLSNNRLSGIFVFWLLISW